MPLQRHRVRRTKLSFRWRGFAWIVIGLFAVPVPALAQAPQPDPSGLPPEPAWPSSTHYYEARVTPEGYALYVPFFIPRETESGESRRVQPPWKEREPRRPTDRDPVGAVGRFELRTREEVIPGEFIQVYRPAVYEIDAQGRTHLVEAEETVTLPKVRIVLERVWVSGLASRDLIPETINETPGDGREASPAEHEPSSIRKQPEMAN